MNEATHGPAVDAVHDRLDLLSWTLNVSAADRTDSWHESARRLIAVLDSLAGALADEHQQAVVWHNPGRGTAPWSDAHRLAEVMEALQIRDDEGNIDPGMGASGTVQGYLGAPPADSRKDPALVSCRWKARDEDRTLDLIAHFDARDDARPLSEHPPQWLARLLCGAVAAAQTNVGRIKTVAWSDEARQRRPVVPDPATDVPVWLGEVTYLPARIAPETLPATLQAYPCESGEGTVVMVRDLEASLHNAAAVMDDLLGLRPHLVSDR